jgi:hypothetical protein
VTKSNLDADQYIWKHDTNWIEFDVTRADHVPKLYDMYNEAKFTGLLLHFHKINMMGYFIVEYEHLNLSC